MSEWDALAARFNVFVLLKLGLLADRLSLGPSVIELLRCVSIADD